MYFELTTDIGSKEVGANFLMDAFFVKKNKIKL